MRVILIVGFSFVILFIIVNYLYDNFKVYWIIFLSFSLLLIGCIAVCIGSVNIPILELIGIIYDKIFGYHNSNTNFDVIIFKIRIPRVLLAGIVGFALAMSGATYQGLDKNPPDEDMSLGLIWPKIQFDHWKDKEKYDFFNAKGDIDLFLDCLNIRSHDYFEIEKKGFDVCYAIKSQNLQIGYIGLIDSKVLKSADIIEEVAYAEISTIKLTIVANLLLKKLFFLFLEIRNDFTCKFINRAKVI